jgi:cation diffusion facilitator CzcD-associated flavoprotein CzcO
MKIIIIEAGIGGLTTALHLHNAGFDVQVYESAKEMKPLGQAPAKTLVVDESGRIGTSYNVKGYLLCSYPNYPRFSSEPLEMVSSYTSAAPDLKVF